MIMIINITIIITIILYYIFIYIYLGDTFLGNVFFFVWPKIAQLPGDKRQRASFLEQLHRARHTADLQLQLLRNPRSQVLRDLRGTTQQLLLGDDL